MHNSKMRFNWKCACILLSLLALCGCGGLHTYRKQPKNIAADECAVQVRTQLNAQFIRNYFPISAGDAGWNAFSLLTLTPDFHTSVKLKGVSTDRTEKDPNPNRVKPTQPRSGMQRKTDRKAVSKTHSQKYDWSQSIYWGDDDFWFIAKKGSKIHFIIYVGGTRNNGKYLATVPISNDEIQTINVLMQDNDLQFNQTIIWDKNTKKPKPKKSTDKTKQ